MTPRLEMHQVVVGYEAKVIVADVSLRLGPGAIGCLLGPSGCGKTTLLRAVAGFEPLRKGSIHIDGAKVASLDVHMPPEQRGVGVVFQDYALFPHLTVRDNVAFGLRGLGQPEVRKRVGEALDLVGLIGTEERYPHQLSGGQQQRVALARAIAPKPRLLLIDEPFSNLDAEMREHLAYELRRILKESRMTALLVTHDQQEGFVMGDEVGVMSAGQLQQWGKAETLYQRPINRFVANFIGHGTLLKVVANQWQGELQTPLGRLNLPEDAEEMPNGKEFEILVRPNQVRVEPAANGNARILRKAFRGLDILYTLRLDSGPEILAVTPTDSQYHIGERMRVSLEVHHPVVLPEQSL